MDELKPTTPCAVDGMPGAEPAASRDGDARKDSVARLLDALSEYERTVSMLVTAVLGLCLSGMDGDADGLRANRTEEKNRPNG